MVMLSFSFLRDHCVCYRGQAVVINNKFFFKIIKTFFFFLKYLTIKISIFDPDCDGNFLQIQKDSWLSIETSIYLTIKKKNVRMLHYFIY